MKCDLSNDFILEFLKNSEVVCNRRDTTSEVLIMGKKNLCTSLGKNIDISHNKNGDFDPKNQE